MSPCFCRGMTLKFSLFFQFKIYFLETVIYPDIVLVLMPLAFFTVKLTVYFLALLYVCAGFLAAEYVPSPKLHFQEVGLLALLSVNCTFKGAFPDTEEAEKAAT